MIIEKSKFEKRHVLYCDLLGFSRYSQSEFFESSKCFLLFQQLDKMIVDAYIEIAPTIPHPISELPPSYIVKPEAIYCSDSIVISTLTTNIDAIWLCEAGARIQNVICAHGFLLRGAIVTDHLYHSGNTIFGPAIAKAVALDKSGNPAVIVVANETLEAFTYGESDEDREIVKIRKYQLIAKENSSLPYVDPFWMVKIHTNQKKSTKASIDCWRSLIETGLRSNNPEILRKYTWIARRFNQTLCNKISENRPISLTNLIVCSSPDS